MKKLFQYAVIYHKRVMKENNQEEIQSELLVEPATVLAADDKVALLMVAKRIPDGHDGHLQHIEILLRPF